MFLSHFEIVHFLKSLELPPCVINFSCWFEVIEFEVDSLKSHYILFSFLKEHFKDLFEQQSDTVAYIYYGDPERKYRLKVKLIEPLDYDFGYDHPLTLVPTWKDLFVAVSSKSKFAIDPLLPILPTCCFYSLKPNLSPKTLLSNAFNLIYLRRLSGCSNPKVLVIDADLSCPNLKLLEQFYSLDVDTSLARLFEIWESTGLNDDYFWSFTNKISSKPLNIQNYGDATLYFLPAFNHLYQLLNQQAYSYPGALVRQPHNSWAFMDKLNTLGIKLGVDCILINLEPGIGKTCNWNAPLLFDPRVYKTICMGFPHKEDLELNLVFDLMLEISERFDFNPSFILPEFEYSFA